MSEVANTAFRATKRTPTFVLMLPPTALAVSVAVKVAWPDGFVRFVPGVVAATVRLPMSETWASTSTLGTGFPAQSVTVTVKSVAGATGFTTKPFGVTGTVLRIIQSGVASFCTNKIRDAFCVSPAIVFPTVAFALITSVRCVFVNLPTGGGV